jgi:nucleotide-binding universal stress UspA family protein
MFKRILLPLDGSKLAEAAIPVAEFLSKTLSAPVILFHVIEQGASPEVHRDRHLTNPSEAENYLLEVESKFNAKVERHVHTAPVTDVARSINEHANKEFQPNLIILTSHGNSGIRGLFFGNIAQQVAAAGGAPVLLIKPGHMATPFRLTHILVPLDNESIHDAVLPTIEVLAKACGSQLDLLCVIPTRATDSGEHAAAGTLLPTTATEYLDIAEEIASEHFQGHLDQFRQADIPATAEIARGDPAPVIVKTAKRHNSNLIVFGTHGKSGLDAFWNRSVTAAVARRTHIPLLLIPVNG